MRFLLKFILILTIILIVTSITLPQTYGLTIPRTPGPALDKETRISHKLDIEKDKSQIVVIGDSTIRLGVDEIVLSELTGKSVYKLSVPGSASAVWYLLLKNNFAESAHKPDYVLVVFRDTILTAPGYRVHGSYFERVDEYARADEPVLIEKSFMNLMNPLERLAERFFPLYISRAEIRKSIDVDIRYITPSLFGCDGICTDTALGANFGAANLEPNALTDAIQSAESYLYTPEQLDFNAQVERSYLPDMIQIAKENNLNLVFVRIKVQSGSGDTPKLKKYLTDLSAYLQEHNVPLLNYGNDPRITPDLFRDAIHLNEQGKILFTQLLADGLKTIPSAQ
jgi:hypothetical protein